jgi:hypothetical protein
MTLFSISYLLVVLAVRRVVVLAALGKITLAVGVESIKMKSAPALLWIPAPM